MPASHPSRRQPPAPEAGGETPLTAAYGLHSPLSPYKSPAQAAPPGPESPTIIHGAPQLQCRAARARISRSPPTHRRNAAGPRLTGPPGPALTPDHHQRTPPPDAPVPALARTLTETADAPRTPSRDPADPARMPSSALRARRRLVAVVARVVGDERRPLHPPTAIRRVSKDCNASLLDNLASFGDDAWEASGDRIVDPGMPGEPRPRAIHRPHRRPRGPLPVRDQRPNRASHRVRLGG